MEKKKWIKTNFKGVRFYYHPTRKVGTSKAVRDRYFAIRYQANGKRIEEGIGWASELDPKDGKHWTPEKAALVLAELREAAKGLREGPSRLSERRDIEDRKKAERKVEEERLLKDAVTLTQFFNDSYLPLAKADRKASSVSREEGLFRLWISPAMGHLPMKDIKPFHLEKLKKTMLDKGRSPRSVEYCLAVVRQIFNAAKRSGAYAGENPATKVKLPKPNNGRMRFLTRDEASRLLAVLKVKSPDVHDMTLLSLHAGLRFGEIANLTWQDVDIAKGSLTIRDAKAGNRYAFLTEQAKEMLKNRPLGGPSDYVFRKRGDEKGGKVQKISHSFFRAVDELGLNRGVDDPRLQICFHTCRHTYASWLIEAGTDLYTVQKLLGHKTNIMTQRYSHIAESKLRGAAQALSEALKSDIREQQVEKVVNLKNTAL